MTRKVIVVGGGPGGYVAAIRAAQLGAEVHLVEKESFGGTCLNVGCIPTKALIHSAEIYQQILQGAPLGIVAESVKVDWSAMMKHKTGVVNRLVQGVGGLLKANGVICHAGKAVLKDGNTVEVIGADRTYNLSGDTIILAMGSENVVIPLPGHDLPGVISSTEALSLPECPKSLVIIGGGVIGVEFASLYSALGTKVTVVELLPEILPMIDSEITGILKSELTKQGVTFLTEGALKKIEKESDQLVALVDHQGESKRLNAEYILIAVGRRGQVSGMNLEETGVLLDRNKVKVNEHFQTSLSTVYAIGDCNGQMMLAHAASAQGAAAVEHALGHGGSYWGKTSPSCIYTCPEVASVGLNEADAKKQGLQIKVGSFPLAGNGKTLIENGGIGLIKIVAGATYGEILGVQIVGPRATDLIAEAGLAIRLEATVDELISTIHGHPTVSEAMAEAAMMVEDGAIHWPPKR